LKRHAYVVGVTDRASRREYPGVYADNFVGVQLVLEHLWSLGHRRIACVVDETIPDGRMRSEVYQQLMREHGTEDLIRVYPTVRTFEGSFVTGQQIFSAADLPTALFATTDAIAIGLLQAAFQSQVAVPTRLSIIGFDDIDLAAFTIPPLTTIRQSGVEMGRIAASLLIDMVEQEHNREQVADVVLTPRLIVRQSTSAPLSV
jgi:LacI family transcriptional regulator